MRRRREGGAKAARRRREGGAKAVRRYAKYGPICVINWLVLDLAASANTIMTPEMDMKLLGIVTVMDDKSMLLEIFEQFCKDAGVAPHISTICRAMKRLGFTRKKVRAVARGTHSHVRRRRHTTLIVFAVTAVVPFVLLAASSRGSRS